MARPKGQPKIGGRQKGTPNKVTHDLMGMAQVYTKDALQVLVEIATDPKAAKPARVAAAVAILDRGHGKPTQAITGKDGKDLITPVLQVVLSGDDA